MKYRKINKINTLNMEKYLKDNKDKSITEIYTEIKNKKFKDRTDEELLIFAYLTMNKKRFGIK